MDVGVQKPFKDAIRAAFSAYLMELYRLMRDNNVPPTEQRCDLRMSVLKPLVPMFLGAAWERLRSDPELVRNTFEQAGILACSQHSLQIAAVELDKRGQLFLPAKDGKDVEEVEEAALDVQQPDQDDVGVRDGYDSDDDKALEKLHRGLVHQQQQPAQAPPAVSAHVAAPSPAPTAFAVKEAVVQRLAAVGKQAAKRVLDAPPKAKKTNAAKKTSGAPGRGRGRGRRGGRAASAVGRKRSAEDVEEADTNEGVSSDEDVGSESDASSIPSERESDDEGDEDDLNFADIVAMCNP